jgi:phthiocerol/phenolphthiocerol synthesis type-I polyketide synthase E
VSQEPPPEEAVAVVGMACRFPGAPDVETFWRNLRDGVESISRFSPAQLLAAGAPPAAVRDPEYVPAGGALGEIERFDAEFFGCTPREAALLDPQQRLFLECAWEALEAAGCDTERFPGRVAVFGGVGLSTYRLRNLAGQDDDARSSTRFLVELGTDKDYVASRTSYKLDLRGPSMTVQTACSTSLVAVQLACQSLLLRQTDVALAGAASVSVPEEAGYWYEEGGILSPDGHCRAFDAAAQGTVPGSGAGMIVLKRLADALADGDRVRAVIRAVAVNNDGSAKAGYTAPGVEGQAEVIAEAHALAGVDPRSITYVEAHGTGTPVGDPIEVRALTRAFRLGTADRGFCALGSVKSNVGHLDTAAGVAGLIKAVLALEHGEIPPTLHFRRPNPACELEASPFFVNAELRPWPSDGTPRRAGVSSFGIGGTNVHVVLEEAPPRPAVPGGRSSHLLVLSARSQPALDRASAALAAHLRAHPEHDLADVAHTLQAGRRRFAHRRAAAVASRDEAVATLEGGGARRPLDGRAEGAPGVVFLLPGQGSQHVRMGRDLYREEPEFRRWLDRCHEVLAPHGIDLLGALYPRDAEVEPAEAALERTALAQPALFAVEYALARTWMAWGVRPRAMLGHSLGEYVAACLAGVLTLEEGLALVAARGRLMQELPGGAMLGVALPVDEVERRLPDGLSLAAVNGPRQCVVSGPTGLVESFRRELAAGFVTCRRLATSHAFHSAMLDAVVEPFVAEVRRVALRAPELPFVSNVHGGWIGAEEATDPAYWGRQLRRSVRFADGVRTVLADPGAVLLEVGPGTVLSTLVQPQSGGRPVVSSMRHPADGVGDDVALLSAVGRLWTLGAAIEWQPGEGRVRVPLPAYPFERRRHWVEPQPAAASAPAATPAPAAEPEPAAVAERPVAARSELEAVVATAWREHFGMDRDIGVTENFFALGGQSLLAVELAGDLRQRLDAPVTLGMVFRNPTIEELAAAIAELRPGDEPPQEGTVPADEADEAVLAEIEGLSADDVEAMLRAEAVHD